jgi:hypothetical protein
MKVASNPRKKTSQYPNFVSDVADQVIGPAGDQPSESITYFNTDYVGKIRFYWPAWWKAYRGLIIGNAHCTMRVTYLKTNTSLAP